MYRRPLKVFGPRSTRSQYPIHQRGEGLGSFLRSIFGGLFNVAKKTLPKIAETAKSVAKSDLAKGVSKQLVNTGAEVASNAIADMIEGKDVKSNAEATLSKARTDIANTIRSSRSDKVDFDEKSKSKPMKRKKVSYGTNKKKKRKKSYSVFEDEEK